MSTKSGSYSDDWRYLAPVWPDDSVAGGTGSGWGTVGGLGQGDYAPLEEGQDNSGNLPLPSYSDGTTPDVVPATWVNPGLSGAVNPTSANANDDATTPLPQQAGANSFASLGTHSQGADRTDASSGNKDPGGSGATSSSADTTAASNLSYAPVNANGGDSSDPTASAGNVTFTVSTPGSSLVFNNTITAGFTQTFQNDIIAAEQTLAGQWSNSITLNINFSAVNKGNTGDLANNSWSFVNVSYATLISALQAHEQSSSYGQAAAASLPTNDPNPAGGNDWSLPEAYARMLGLSSSTPTVDDTVTLNTFYNYTYGQDVINALTHEISEGAMGRVGGLGDQNSAWSTMDLFRFNASGARDYTDGRDGATTYFSYNGGQTLSSLAGLSFNNQYRLSGGVATKINGGDTADFTQQDVFGTGSVGETNTLSQTDIEVMDALGWGPPLPPPSTPAGTSADMVMQLSTNGTLQLYDIGGNAALAAYTMGQVGSNMTFAGLGGFNGSDTSDMLLRDSNTGNFQLYDISNSQITGTNSLGSVGLEWQVSGFGDFSGNPGETDMLLRQNGTGAFEYYDIANNQITGVGSLGGVGTEWQVLGVGDFSDNTNETDMLMRNSNTNAIEYYDIRNNHAVTSGSLAGIGIEWQAVGFGDFSTNPGETDMLMRDVSTGAFEYYDIRDNQIVAAGSMGGVGLNWQVVGVGNLSSNPNETDMLMRNSNTGAFEYYDIQNNHVTAVGSMGGVGLAWNVLGIGVATPTS